MIGTSGLADALAAGWLAFMSIVFGAGVFIGWLLFSCLPDNWPAIKQWIHTITA